MEIQKIFSEIRTGEKLYSISLSESEFKLYQKEFGLFSSGVDIYEFLDLARDCNYPVKVEGLIGNSYKCETTWKVFKKSLGRLKSSTTKKIKDVLDNAEEEIKNLLKENRINGNILDFELYDVFLVKDNDSLKLGFGLIPKKNISNLSKGTYFSLYKQLK